MARAIRLRVGQPWSCLFPTDAINSMEFVAVSLRDSLVARGDALLPTRLDAVYADSPAIPPSLSSSRRGAASAKSGAKRHHHAQPLRTSVKKKITPHPVGFTNATSDEQSIRSPHHWQSIPSAQTWRRRASQETASSYSPSALKRISKQSKLLLKMKGKKACVCIQ